MKAFKVKIKPTSSVRENFASYIRRSSLQRRVADQVQIFCIRRVLSVVALELHHEGRLFCCFTKDLQREFTAEVQVLASK